MPKKRSKKNPLSAAGKKSNRALAGVAGENVIALLKRFKIIADRYRNRRRRFSLRFLLIAAISNMGLQVPGQFCKRSNGLRPGLVDEDEA